MNTADSSKTFTVPITVMIPKGDWSLLGNHNDTFMSISHEMTIKQVKERVVEMYRKEVGIDYSKKNIHIVIKGKDTSDDEKCEYYDIDSATCLKINIGKENQGK